MANLQDIMNCGTFKSRPASDFKESIPVLETSLVIALGKVQWNRSHRAQATIKSLTIRPAKGFCDRD
jgi:hypothetical protein